MTYQNKGDGGFLYLHLFAYVHPIKTYNRNILSIANYDMSNLHCTK